MKLTTYVGDSLGILCSVKARAGSALPLDLTGCTIAFRAVSSSGTAVVLDKAIGTGVTVTDEDSGSFRVDLTPTDTQALGVAGGALKFSIRVTVDVNHIHTVGVGTILIKKSL